MQQKGFAHLGISPEHVMLVHIKKTKSWLVKLLGFGQAMKEGANQFQHPSHHPDSLFKPPEATGHNQLHKQDVWATGIILMQLIAGERHFPNFRADRKKIISEIISKQSLPGEKGIIIMDLLGKMLLEEPEQRLSAIEALKHQVFKIVWGDDMMSKRS